MLKKNKINKTSTKFERRKDVMESKHVFLSAALQMMDVYLYRAVVLIRHCPMYIYISVFAVSSPATAVLLYLLLHYIMFPHNRVEREQSHQQPN